MSRILWQDLTLTTTDTAILEEEYSEIVRIMQKILFFKAIKKW